MSDNSQSRIERLEALAEEILKGLAETRQRTDSNAKSIEALTNEWQKDRNRLYEAMSRMAAAQSTFWEIQGDYYRRLEEVDKRQAQIIEILNRLTQKDNNG